MIKIFKKKLKKCDSYDIEMAICNVLIVAGVVLLIFCIVSWIINMCNKIDSGIVVDKHHTSAHSTPTRFGFIHHPESYTLTIKGDKDGKTIEYTFYCSEEEYDLYDIGDEYPKEEK
jgi:hypothetical protein